MKRVIRKEGPFRNVFVAIREKCAGDTWKPFASKEAATPKGREKSTIGRGGGKRGLSILAVTCRKSPRVTGREGGYDVRGGQGMRVLLVPGNLPERGQKTDPF